MEGNEGGEEVGGDGEEEEPATSFSRSLFVLNPDMALVSCEGSG